MSDTDAADSAALTCPSCQHVETLEMPTDACLFFHRCVQCGAVMRPLPGDCCVFCSYGSVKCPPKRSSDACCT